MSSFLESQIFLLRMHTEWHLSMSWFHTTYADFSLGTGPVHSNDCHLLSQVAQLRSAPEQANEALARRTAELAAARVEAAELRTVADAAAADLARRQADAEAATAEVAELKVGTLGLSHKYVQSPRLQGNPIRVAPAPFCT
jgi:hypothetical protein